METPIKGKLILDDGVYEGDVVNYIPHGRGKKTFTEGSVYEGDWTDGSPDGKGIFLLSCGHIYKGDFSNGKMTGKGKMKYVDDGVCSYEGDYVDGKPHGIGKMTFADGNICEGEFTNGVPCGKTHWTFPKGLPIEKNETGEENNAVSETVKPDNDFSDSVDPNDYDVIINAKNEVMIVMYAREGQPSSPRAYRTENKDILLKRGENDAILFDSLPEESFEPFTKISTVLLNEIDNDGNTIHIYDVPLSDL